MLTWLKKQLRSRVIGSLEKWIISGGKPESAFYVDGESAKSVDVLYSCVNVIGEDTSTIPLQLYEKTENGRRLATDHELYPIIHGAWNPLMTGAECREMIASDMGFHGNGLALIDMDRAARVTGIYPVNASSIRIRINRDNPRRPFPVYFLVVDGNEQHINSSMILHVRYKSFRPFIGQSPVSFHAESIGLTKAAETYGREFFENNARGDLYLKHPKTLSPDAQKRLLDTFLEKTRDRHRPVVLEEGLDVHSPAMPLKDLQLLELREFQGERVAMLYRVAPHKVGLLRRATFSNIENQDLDHAKSCIRPWAVRLETAFARCLLGPREAQSFYFEHNLDALMRGDLKGRMEAHGTAIQWSIMSPNRAAQIENLPTFAGGDVRLMPANMYRISEASGEILPGPPPTKQSQGVAAQ